MGGGGGVTPLYKSYGFVPPQRVWFLRLFGLKTGINFGLESGMVFKGTTGVISGLEIKKNVWSQICD